MTYNFRESSSSWNLNDYYYLLLLNPNPPLRAGDQLLERDLQPNPPRLAGDLDLDLLIL